MDYLADYGASRPARLDTAAKLSGFPGKVDASGSDVVAMVAAGRLREMRDYCLTDVVQTAGIFLRLQLVRGILSRDDYRRAATALLALIDQNDRLAALRPGLDRARILVLP
jgi:hypothetical protein